MERYNRINERREKAKEKIQNFGITLFNKFSERNSQLATLLPFSPNIQESPSKQDDNLEEKRNMAKLNLTPTKKKPTATTHFFTPGRSEKNHSFFLKLKPNSDFKH